MNKKVNKKGVISKNILFMIRIVQIEQIYLKFIKKVLICIAKVFALF